MDLQNTFLNFHSVSRIITAMLVSFIHILMLFISRPYRDRKRELVEYLRAERLGELFTGETAHHVIDANTGAEVWSREPDTFRNPASTQKLLTLLAVLDKMGPAAKFTTQVEAVGTLTEGVLDGDLYLVGSGDPALEIGRWWKLAIDTQIAGIHEI